MATSDKVVLQGAIGVDRSHYCPKCPADEDGKLQSMSPTMIMPGRSMVYHCKSGHTVRRGQTLLR